MVMNNIAARTQININNVYNPQVYLMTIMTGITGSLYNQLPLIIPVTPTRPDKTPEYELVQ